jgi:hypothetical protein
MTTPSSTTSTSLPTDIAIAQAATMQRIASMARERLEFPTSIWSPMAITKPRYRWTIWTV